MSKKRGIAIFLVLTVVQSLLYFSGLLMGIVMLPLIGVIIWLAFLPGSLIFDVLSGADATLMRMFPYLGVFPILINSVIYTSLLALLTKVCRHSLRLLDRETSGHHS